MNVQARPTRTSSRRRAFPTAMTGDLLLVLSSALLPSSLAAREWFVDQKHAEAGDRNEDSQAKPLRTVQAAVDKAQAGDTIWIKAGRYEESVEVRSSGRIDSPITLSAWKDNRVRLGSVLRELPAAK